MPEKSQKKVDFDDYSEDYENLLKQQLSFFSGDRAYFSRYKIETLRRLYPQGFGNILDFGSGIGLTLPHLKDIFPEALVSATDISQASLKHIEANFADVRVLADNQIDAHRFDLILVITVLHHVAPALRASLISRLEGLLSENGVICVFEHNPYNPVTQRMVSTCPFDEDAVLLFRRETIGLFKENTDLEIAHAGYTLFFPEQLSGLRAFEPFMSSIPLGGQYFVAAKRVRP